MNIAKYLLIAISSLNKLVRSKPVTSYTAL